MASPVPTGAGSGAVKLFQVDIASFAVAGAFVIFLMSLEMILDIEIFKNQGPIKEATLVPLVFPLLAGAGAFTTLLSLRSEYAPVNIVIALILNMVWVYVVLKLTDTGAAEAFFGDGISKNRRHGCTFTETFLFFQAGNRKYAAAYGKCMKCDKIGS